MIKYIAVDDEPLALDLISIYASRIPDMEPVAMCSSAQQAAKYIECGGVDLLILDINMPWISGLDFAKSLGQKAPCIVFTTAYPQYAVEGFRLDAVDYLLKPLAFDDFEQAISRVRRRLMSTSTNGASISVKDRGAIRKIMIDNIACINGLREYVQILLRDSGETITTLESMKNLEDLLPYPQFIRIHKSHIINTTCLERADSRQATVCGRTLQVGEKYRKTFMSLLPTLFR